MANNVHTMPKQWKHNKTACQLRLTLFFLLGNRFSAVKGALFFHPNGRDYIYPAGGTVVIADFNDPHNQVHLQITVLMHL